MKNTLLTIISSVVLLSCSSPKEHEYEYLPLSKFKNDTSLIQPNTTVKLLAISGGKENDKDGLYYSQLLVVNQQTGDSIIVLTPALKVPSPSDVSTSKYIVPNQLDPVKNIKEAKYQQLDSSVIDLLEFSALALDADISIEEIENMNNFSPSGSKKPRYVSANKTLEVFSKTYPTVIGVLEFSEYIGQ